MPEIEQLNIEIYGGCNYTCQMCPQSKEMGGREHSFKGKIPFAVFTKTVEEAMKYGLKSVSLHGSGEPTLHPQLVQMVKFVSDQGIQPSFFTNGLRLTGALFERLADAGLTLATVSLVGADRERYRKYMNKDSFDAVLANLHQCAEIMRRGKGEFHTRHLIMDSEHKDEEKNLYLHNIIEPLGCKAEIWMPHNWAGTYDAEYNRFEHAPKKLRSCGRPFANTLEVRAGGNGGHTGAVVACPFLLGKDSQGVLGHLDTQSIAEVLEGEPLAALRQAHQEGRFDDISYCRGCDMLANDPEVLVWSNIKGRHVGQSKTSNVDYLQAGRTVQPVES